MRTARFIYPLLFLFFLTVSTELLHVNIYLFKPKLNHLFALLLLIATVYLSKGIKVPRKLGFCILFLLSSLFISSFFSPCFLRSVGYLLATAFTLLLFFFLPIHLMLTYDHEKCLRLYFASFLCVGIYAALQFVFSFFGIYDPVCWQRIGEIAKGQALTYEASYYALYAIAFVMFYNTKKLLEAEKLLQPKHLLALLFVNLLLLSSTSTSAFFGYLFFPFAVFAAVRWAKMSSYVQGLRKKIVKITLVCAALFAGFAFCNMEMFLRSFFKFFYIGFLQHESFLDRWTSVVDNWNLFLEHPLFGVGLGGAGPMLYLKENFLLEKSVLWRPDLEMFHLVDPHNVFPELLASLGIYGALAFGVFLVAVGGIFRAAFKNPLLEQHERTRLFAFLISILVMLFCLQFNQGLFRSYVWLHLGMAVGYALKVNSNAYSRHPLISSSPVAS